MYAWCLCSGLVLLLWVPRLNNSFLLSWPQSPQLIKEDDIPANIQGLSLFFFFRWQYTWEILHFIHVITPFIPLPYFWNASQSLHFLEYLWDQPWNTLFSVVIPKYLKLGSLSIKKVYLAQSSGGLKLKQHSTDSHEGSFLMSYEGNSIAAWGCQGRNPT